VETLFPRLHISKIWLVGVPTQCIGYLPQLLTSPHLRRGGQDGVYFRYKWCAAIGIPQFIPPQLSKFRHLAFNNRFGTSTESLVALSDCGVCCPIISFYGRSARSPINIRFSDCRVLRPKVPHRPIHRPEIIIYLPACIDIIAYGLSLSLYSNSYCSFVSLPTKTSVPSPKANPPFPPSNHCFFKGSLTFTKK